MRTQAVHANCSTVVHFSKSIRVGVGSLCFTPSNLYEALQIVQHSALPSSGVLRTGMLLDCACHV